MQNSIQVYMQHSHNRHDSLFCILQDHQIGFYNSSWLQSLYRSMDEFSNQKLINILSKPGSVYELVTHYCFYSNGSSIADLIGHKRCYLRWWSFLLGVLWHGRCCKCRQKSASWFLLKFKAKKMQLLMLLRKHKLLCAEDSSFLTSFCNVKYK